MYVGGSWVESESGERLEAISPATGETIGSVPEATRDDTRRAIAAAGSHSGIGRVGGRFSMETFTELKTVVVNLG